MFGFQLLGNVTSGRVSRSHCRRMGRRQLMPFTVAILIMWWDSGQIARCVPRAAVGLPGFAPPRDGNPEGFFRGTCNYRASCCKNKAHSSLSERTILRPVSRCASCRRVKQLARLIATETLTATRHRGKVQGKGPNY